MVDKKVLKEAKSHIIFGYGNSKMKVGYRDKFGNIRHKVVTIPEMSLGSWRDAIAQDKLKGRAVLYYQIFNRVHWMKMVSKKDGMYNFDTGECIVNYEQVRIDEEKSEKQLN